MSADFAGALRAIKEKFAAEWIVDGAPRTRIAEVSRNPAAPWPPKDVAGKLLPWVLIAPVGVTSDHHGFGTPGQQLFLYQGLIHIHVYAAVGQGADDAFALAVAAGEIFRAKTFYDQIALGCYVRSLSPRVDGGAPGDDDGIWFRVTATIPFDYIHQG